MTPQLQQTIQTALQQHQAGRLAQAEGMYREVLAQDPNNAHALHYLGLVAHQNGQNAAAAELMQRSLAQLQNNPGFYSNYSAVCRALGRARDAIDAAQRAIRMAPTFADAYNNLCLALLDEKNYKDAADAARRAIQLKPRLPQAHNNLGTALAEQGAFAEAIEAFRVAVTLQPEFVQAHLNLAKALARLEWHEQAVASLRRAIELSPDHPEAQLSLATALLKLERSGEALVAARRACDLRPDSAEAHNTLGVALDATGNTEEAIAHWRRALDLDENYADSLNNLAIAFDKQDKLDQAIEYWRRAIALRPSLLEAQANLGNALAKQGRFDEAIACCREIIRVKPDYAQAYNNLGVALSKYGRAEEGVAMLRRAVELKGDYREALINLGGALEKLKRYDDVITTYQRAIAVKPDSPDAYNNLAVIYQTLCAYEESERFSRKALELDPEFQQAHLNLGNTMLDRRRLPEALASYRRAHDLKPDDLSALNNLLMASNYPDTLTPEEVAREHFRFGQQYDALASDAPPHMNVRDPNKRIRIAYVSPDFRNHAVAFFIEPVLAEHDHERFEIFCYSSVEKNDPTTDRLRQLADCWRDVATLTDAKLAEVMRDDQVDVLIDLTGHTGGNRLLAMARRPAPVQVEAIGYPNTTGLKTIDYIFGDPHSDPPGMTEEFYSETVWRLPETFWVYRPPQPCPEVTTVPPFESRGGMTFGSVNNLSKVTPTVVRTWAQVLQRVPRSRLIIQSKSLIDPGTCQCLHETFSNEGIEADRVVLQPWNDFADYLRLFNTIDVALDPFPYNGGTTTCHTLWMGVPLVALAGRTHASRMGVSALMNIDLPELIASSIGHYVDIAAELALDGDRLAKLRCELRERMRNSPLCDARRYTRHLESAYLEMFKRWCANTKTGSN